MRVDDAAGHNCQALNHDTQLRTLSTLQAGAYTRPLFSST
jgi:hypothetical protein